MNRTRKTNASKGIEKCYNEYKEFHNREIEAHVCTAFMQMSDMRTMNGQYLATYIFLIKINCHVTEVCDLSYNIINNNNYKSDKS